MTEYSLDLIGRMLAEMQQNMRTMQQDVRDLRGAQMLMAQDVLEMKERLTRVEVAGQRTEQRLTTLEVSHRRLEDGIRDAIHHLRAEAERR